MRVTRSCPARSCPARRCPTRTPTRAIHSVTRPTKVSLQFGVEIVSTNRTNPPVISDFLRDSRAELREEAEDWFSRRFGLTFAKENLFSKDFKLELVSSVTPYAMWSFFDSTRYFRNDLALEIDFDGFMAHLAARKSNFRYGGSYARENFPEDAAARPGDNFSYGIYSLRQGARVAEIKARSLHVAKAKSIMTKKYFTNASLMQLDSPLWGPGIGCVHSVTQISQDPDKHYFAMSMRFPAPEGLDQLGC